MLAKQNSYSWKVQAMTTWTRWGGFDHAQGIKMAKFYPRSCWMPPSVLSETHKKVITHTKIKVGLLKSLLELTNIKTISYLESISAFIILYIYKKIPTYLVVQPHCWCHLGIEYNCHENCIKNFKCISKIWRYISRIDKNKVNGIVKLTMNWNSHISTAVAWREKKSKHFGFCQNFSGIRTT